MCISRQCVWSDWATGSQRKARNTCPLCGALSSCGELDLKMFRPHVFQEFVMGFVFSYLALRRAKRYWNIYSTSVAKLCLLLPLWPWVFLTSFIFYPCSLPCLTLWLSGGLLRETVARQRLPQWEAQCMCGRWLLLRLSDPGETLTSTLLFLAGHSTLLK